MPILFIIFDRVIQLYILLIFVWSLGSWFPQWRNAPWYRLVGDIVKPYLNLFARLNLRNGQFDFTALVAMLVLMAFYYAVTLTVAGGLN